MDSAQKGATQSDHSALDQGVCIDHRWRLGRDAEWTSVNPVDDAVLWRSQAAGASDVDEAVCSARRAYLSWSQTTLEERMDVVQRFTELLRAQSEAFAALICTENGKPLWDARLEVAAMLGKGAISLRAYEDRSGVLEKPTANGLLRIRHRPHGVLAVFGPFNFPGHLPNGHIIPALLAGNAVLFKPSELTPKVGCALVALWQQAGLPAGVLNLLCGDKETGHALANHLQVDGLLFTGSAQTGHYLHQQYGGQPHKMLALEMGGNNPLIVEPVKKASAALFTVMMSAFVSSGQRCTCARRLLLPNSPWGDDFLQSLSRAAASIHVARGDADPQPFMGALISRGAEANVQAGLNRLCEHNGTLLLAPTPLNDARTLMAPALVDMSGVSRVLDEELFGPVLQVFRYDTLEEAIAQANDTRYGLAAGLLSDDANHQRVFLNSIRAGIANCNRPLTGASSEAPFGGVGASGNHRPSAYYAADYCAYPVATLQSDEVALPDALPPGLHDALA